MEEVNFIVWFQLIELTRDSDATHHQKKVNSCDEISRSKVTPTEILNFFFAIALFLFFFLLRASSLIRDICLSKPGNRILLKLIAECFIVFNLFWRFQTAVFTLS